MWRGAFDRLRSVDPASRPVSLSLSQVGQWNEAMAESVGCCVACINLVYVMLWRHLTASMLTVLTVLYIAPVPSVPQSWF